MKFLSSAFIAAIVGLLFLSCEKKETTPVSNNNITIDLNESGTASLKVVDLNGVGVENAKVFIDVNLTEHSFVRILEGVTGADGVYNSGKLLPDNYRYFVGASEGKMTYKEVNYFQITADTKNEIVATPYQNTAELLLIVKNYNDGIAKPNMNVIIIDDSWDDIEWTPLQVLIDMKLLYGKTNEDGEVEFKNIPAINLYSRGYTLIVYDDNQNYLGKHLSISKGYNNQNVGVDF